MFRPTLITPPVGQPVELEEAKRHGVVDFSYDDALFQAYIEAATAHLDGFGGLLGRCMMTQTWQVERGCFDRCFVLPVPDVTEVVVKYDDAEGVEQTVDAGAVTFHPVATGTRVVIADSFATPSMASAEAPVRVEFTAGFGDASAVPKALKVAIMMMVAHYHSEREGVAISDPFYDRLIGQYRWSFV